MSDTDNTPTAPLIGDTAGLASTPITTDSVIADTVVTLPIVEKKEEKKEKAKSKTPKEKPVVSEPPAVEAKEEDAREFTVDLDEVELTVDFTEPTPGELKHLVTRAIENSAALTIDDAEKAFDEATKLSDGTFTPEQISTEIRKKLQ